MENQQAVIIDGIDRTADVINQSIQIQDVINDQQDTCSFALYDRFGNGTPNVDDTVEVIDKDGNNIFSGKILKISIGEKQTHGNVVAQIECVDWVRDFDRRLVRRTYENMTDKAIIEDIVNNYTDGTFTTHGVVEGVTITEVTFNFVQPSQAIRKICDEANRNWYIDNNKDIKYFANDYYNPPMDIYDASSFYKDLKITKDGSQLKNRVFVRGGSKLSDTTTFSQKGDSSKRKFLLPEKPHDMTLTINGVSKSVGIKNVHTSGYDFYLSFQEKYLEQDPAGTVLSPSDTLTITYKYDVPILIVQESTESIEAHGVHEFAIFDKTLNTTQSARSRALAELTDYANSIVEGSFSTLEKDFRSGQKIHIEKTDYGIDDDYIINSVSISSMGSGEYKYDIKIASAKTMGIIRFLIELLESDKNMVELDSDEVLDELLPVEDTIASPTENITATIGGKVFKWSNDTGTTTNKLRWSMGQWA